MRCRIVEETEVNDTGSDQRTLIPWLFHYFPFRSGKEM